MLKGWFRVGYRKVEGVWHTVMWDVKGEVIRSEPTDMRPNPLLQALSENPEGFRRDANVMGKKFEIPLWRDGA